jgi:plasmid stability protein
MAKLFVRNLDDQLLTSLQRRSERNVHSMEDEARKNPSNAVREEEAPTSGP